MEYRPFYFIFILFYLFHFIFYFYLISLDTSSAYIKMSKTVALEKSQTFTSLFMAYMLVYFFVYGIWDPPH